MLTRMLSVLLGVFAFLNIADRFDLNQPTLRQIKHVAPRLIAHSLRLNKPRHHFINTSTHFLFLLNDQYSFFD